jgi:magnesium chelatase subunit D
MTAPTGRHVRSAPIREGDRPTDLAFDATLRAAALRRSVTGQAGSAPGKPSDRIQRADFRRKIRERRRSALVVFVVDASESMGASTRMAAAKGAVLALLTHAYQKRERVAVVAFFDKKALVLLPPTHSSTLAQEHLRRLPTGGATPLAQGLMTAWDLIRTERVKDPETHPLLVLISDGDANVPFTDGADVTREVHRIARAIRADGIQTVAVDTELGIVRSDKMRRIAEALGAGCHHIDRLRPRSLVRAVRDAEHQGE